MQKLPDVSIDKINSFNEKAFYIEITVKTTSIKIETFFSFRNFTGKQADVFFDITGFFGWWIKQHFQNPSKPFTMRGDTDFMKFFTFNTTKNLWNITDMTKQAVEEFKQDRNIPPENFQLVSEYSPKYSNEEILRYEIKIPKVAVTKHIRLNNLKELRF